MGGDATAQLVGGEPQLLQPLELADFNRNGPCLCCCIWYEVSTAYTGDATRTTTAQPTTKTTTGSTNNIAADNDDEDDEDEDDDNDDGDDDDDDDDADDGDDDGGDDGDDDSARVAFIQPDSRFMRKCVQAARVEAIIATSCFAFGGSAANMACARWAGCSLLIFPVICLVEIRWAFRRTRQRGRAGCATA